MSDDPVIRTARLDLVPIDAGTARSIMDADWPAVERRLGTPFPEEWRADGWQWLAAQAHEGAHDPRFVAWGNRLVFAAGDGGTGPGPVLGEVGFHGPPSDDGRVEIGYQVVARCRRRGYAEESATALIGWARERGAAGVMASIAPDNEPSTRLVRKLGFTEGERHHHDVLGEQIRYRLPLTPRSRAGAR